MNSSLVFEMKVSRIRILNYNHYIRNFFLIFDSIIKRYVGLHYMVYMLFIYERKKLLIKYIKINFNIFSL
jgi:hypothetical protein